VYLDFYGLRELPFELSPNPKYLLLTARHREALANLQYGISARKSLTVLLGEAGTGKTTLVQAALQSPPCRSARVVHLANPMLSREEFVEFLARAFGLSPAGRRSKTTMLAELEGVLRRRRQAGITTALVIDEAQVLPEDLLEEVRLLANIETPTEKLLPLVLVGQPELADRLNRPSLRQLKQRVALRCSLDLLGRADTHAYVNGRLHIAGANGVPVFTQEAIDLVYVRSRGVPRTISVICDNALVSGFAASERTIGPDLVHEVCADFDLGPRPAPLSPRVAHPAGPDVTLPPPVGPESRARPRARNLEPGIEKNRGPSALAHRVFARFARKKRFGFF
jgi:type II secretory pathway predicted ATPase ExeA